MTGIIAHFRRFNPVGPRLSLSVDLRLIKMASRKPADGDVRKHLSPTQSLDIVWILRCLHHIATGLHQLHSAKVAHQDLKPSNVLAFRTARGKGISTIPPSCTSPTSALPKRNSFPPKR